MLFLIPAFPLLGFLLNAAGKDVFIHFSSIEGDGFRSLKDGEKVEYEEIEGTKGLSAKSVRMDGGLFPSRLLSAHR